MKKYKIKFETKMRCVREVNVKTDDEAIQIARKIADGLEQEDFDFDPAYTEMVDIQEIN